MQKILIMVDSSTTLPLNVAKENEIEILPLSIYRNDNVSYIYESLSMTSKDFLKMGDEGFTFKTGCTPQGILEDVVNEKLKKYDQIIALPISQKWSSQYSHLKALSSQDEYKDKLFVVDTLEYGYAIECLALELREMIKKNIFNINDLLKYAQNYHNYTICYFACNELTGLVNSGRVPKMIGKIFKLAKIKPVIRVEGENHLETIIKNFPEVINRIIKAIIKIYGGKLVNRDIKKITILTSNNELEFINEVILDLSKTFDIPKNAIDVRPAPNIFVNIVGNGAIGVHVISKKMKEQ